jgi:cobalt-zinc-cadmium efflux system outer membrane protein
VSLTSRPPSVTFKTPMVPRCSAVVVWLLSALGSPLATTTAAAQALLVEEAVVGRVLARADVTALAEGEAAEAHALGLVEGAWPNPDMGYTREETFGNGGSGEDYVWASQRIDVSGRLFMRRDAGDRRAGAARIAGEQRRADLAAAARMAFYGVLAADARAEALGSWCVQISAALRLVEARERAGDAAPYDETRLRRELRAATARRDEARAQVQRARWHQLASLAASSTMTGIVLRGQLAPSADGELVVRRYRRQSRRCARSESSRRAADRSIGKPPRVPGSPSSTLGAGYKGVSHLLVRAWACASTASR